MRVLLLAYYYPPSPAVGGLRARKVAYALRDAGHEVHVLAARLPGETAGLRQQEPGLIVEAVATWRSPRELINALNARWKRDATAPATPPADEASPAPPPARVPTWKRWFYSFLWLPDDKQGFILPAARAVRRAAGSGPSVLYSTGPPFSVHLAALLVTTFVRLPWVLELRDPWTDSHFRLAHQRSWLATVIERRLERMALRRARLVVSVSEGIQRGLVAKLPTAHHGKCVVIRNGIEQLEAPRPPRLPNHPFLIAYVGSFYHRRDPFPFLEGLAAVVRRHCLDASSVRVELVGQCRRYAGRPIEPWSRDHGLEEIITIRDWVPPADAQAVVSRADLLLLLAQDQPDQVPNKLYEYLGARVPILAFADAEGESARMLNETGGHYLVNTPDPVLVEQHLERALGLAAGAPPDPRAEVLEQWRTPLQMAELISAITRVAGTR